MASPAPWVAEHFVDAELAGRLIEAQFPGLAGAAVTPLAEGWDNTVYLVGDEWVFRFPRRAIALLGFRFEIEFLPLLAARLPLPVPVPELVGSPAASYPWPFWGGRFIAGTELALTELPDGKRTALASQLGAFLRALHDPQSAADVKASLASDPGPPGGVRAELRIDPNARSDPGAVAMRARDRLGRLESAGLWASSEAACAVLAAAEAVTPVPAWTDSIPPGPVLVHGDLHLRHVLVGADGRAAGVIDWGDACLADPAVDLCLAYAAFAGPDRAAFVEAYGPVGADREADARVLALFLCAALAEHAADVGAAVPLRTALAGLDRAVAD